MKSTSAQDYGRKAAHLKPEVVERCMSAIKKKEEGLLNESREKTKIRKAFLADIASQYEHEISLRGNLSQVMTRESLIRALFMGICLLVCVAGDFVLAKWMVGYFGLSQWESYIVALTIVIATLEILNLYIGSLRRQFPHLENYLFTIIGSFGFILVMVMIVVGAEIRAELSQTILMINNSPTSEDIVRNAERFTGDNTRPFTFLLAVLTGAASLSAGICYHDLKNRIIMALSFMRLHNGLDKAKNEQMRLDEQLIEQESKLDTFEADFQYGLLIEQQKLGEDVKGASLRSNIQQNAGTYLGFIVTSPIFLVLIALLLIFIFSTAVRAETIVLLDMTGSSVASDYKGQETEFQKNVAGVDSFMQVNLAPGGRIKIIGITERSFSSPYILLEGEITTERGAFGEKIAKDKLKLLEMWRKLDLNPTAKSSDIFGAIQLASIFFSQNETKRQLIIFSDMRQYGRDTDLETPQIIDVDITLKHVTSQRLVPSLDGVRVWCVGVHSAGKSAEYWKSLKNFWTRYFREAHAIEPIIFSMERRVTDYE